MDYPLLFLLKKAVAELLLPPLLPLLCLAAGLLWWRRRPRVGKVLAWFGLALSLFLSIPATVYWLVAPLENLPPVTDSQWREAQAIVILGAGFRRFAPEYGHPIPNRLALERLRYGSRLAKLSRLPVLLSGEATLMADALRVDFGVSPRWIENSSLDTHDNARLSAAILKAEGIQRVVLVTHAAHMRRSMAEFALQGIETLPAPTGFLGDGGGELDHPLFHFLPSATAAFSGAYAAHEWLGLLALRVRSLFSSGASV